MTTKQNAPRLQVKGIRKAFGQNVVLKGIDLSVDAGEVVALIGGNGARQIHADEDYHGHLHL